MTKTCLIARLLVLAGLVYFSVIPSGNAAGVLIREIKANAYTHPQRMVAVDGIRRLNLFCLGHGTPVVVLESGTGDGSLTWRHVQAAIAGSTRVCAYDRAGYGFSDPATRPTDAKNSVDDLHRLLKAADIDTPIILVGHSVGGLYSTLYAETYLQDVGGMVLLDPVFAGSNHMKQSRLSGPKKEEIRVGIANFISGARSCLNMALNKELTKPENQKSICLNTPADADPVIHKELNRQ